jgi:hypothetical protein
MQSPAEFQLSFQRERKGPVLPLLRMKASHRALDCQVQVRLWVVAGRTFTISFSIFVHAHSHKALFGKVVKDVTIGMVGWEIVQGVATEPSDQKYTGKAAGAFGLREDYAII